MEPGERLALVLVAIIATTAVASGPLVGAVDLTPAPPTPAADVGTGTANVTIVSAPSESIRLVRGAFGSGTYHLEGPPAVVEVGRVTGVPYLEYLVRIPALDFADVHSYLLPDAEGSRLALAFRPVELSPRLVEKRQYRAHLEIRLQSDEYAVLYEASVRVDVSPP